MSRKRILLSLCMATLFWMQSCSSIDAMRTHELEKVGTEVTTDTRHQLDSLRLIIASLQKDNLRTQHNLLAKIGQLDSRLDNISDKAGTHQSEMLQKLDLLVSASARPLKRVVIDKRAPHATNSPNATEPDTGADDSIDSTVDPAIRSQYTEARTAFANSEYKLAYDDFKAIYEKASGNVAENSLYWMALCLSETNQSEKSQVVFHRLVDQFPAGKKTCIILYKLAEFAGAAKQIDDQTQLLERLTAQPQCHESNEAYSAIGILDQIKK